jgi:hypothetical protein
VQVNVPHSHTNSLNLDNVTFSGSQVGSFDHSHHECALRGPGGAILFGDTRSDVFELFVTMRNVRILDGGASDGGGIAFAGLINPLLWECTTPIVLERNAAYAGGALFFSDKALLINDQDAVLSLKDMHRRLDEFVARCFSFGAG